MTQTVLTTFRPVAPGARDTIAVVALNRSEVANAFNGDMLNELTIAFQKVANTKHCRAMLLCGKGKHFSAGADLNWMKASSKLSLDQNLDDAKQLTAMFEALAQLPVPTIAALHGAAYGGAVGLIAACDVVVAVAGARLCLSEVKVGLIPAVIVPYVSRRLPYGSLRRYGLTGQVMTAEYAREVGLVDRYAQNAEEMKCIIREEIDAMLAASPAAQKRLKKLLNNLQTTGFAQSDMTAEAIAQTRISEEGQAGLQAFFNKTPAPWLTKLAIDWTWEDLT